MIFNPTKEVLIDSSNDLSNSLIIKENNSKDKLNSEIRQKCNSLNNKKEKFKDKDAINRLNLFDEERLKKKRIFIGNKKGN